MSTHKKSGFKQNYLLICEYASLSQSDKMNALGIFDNISGPETPVSFPQMYLVSNTTVPKEDKYIVNIILEEKISSKEILRLNYELEARKDRLNLGIIAQLLNIQFPSFGTYVFKIQINNLIVAEKEIQISKK